MANTIDSQLQLTEILDSALTAFKRSVVSLNAFSTVYRDVSLKGDDTVDVPYYPLATDASASRDAAGSYKALVTDTDTQTKTITINKNKVQGLSFTGREVSRQPVFDPVKHGQIKGEKLGYDIVADVLSVVTKANFSGNTIAATTAANFDEEDVADLAQDCEEAEWPKTPRSLILNPAFHYNLVKQPALIDLSQSGSNVLNTGMLPNIMGFDTYCSNGVPTNNGTATACTFANASDVFTDVAHGLTNNDIVQLAGTAVPTGFSTSTDYYVISATDDTFQLSATEGGAAVDASDDGTDVTYQLFERLAGFAVGPSAVLCAFAPVPPTAGVRQLLVDYQQVTDSDTGATLEYKRIAYPDTDEEAQFIEAHYGYVTGEAAALKRIITS
jgi:hypothetical protein